MIKEQSMLTLQRRFAAGVATLGLGLLLALLIGPQPGVQAQTLPPRPTAQPTPTSRRDTSPPPAQGGRITGTVIDSTSGAPAPNIAVDIGDARVLTDANGNYDRQGLAAGTYTVTLALAPGQGTAAQGPIAVVLNAGQTVVQHLSFRSPVAPAATPTPVPLVPAELPHTGAVGLPAGWLAALGAGLVLLGVLLGARRVHR